MFLSCPNCLTSYTIQGVKIDSGGQVVRCSNCGHTWHYYQVFANTVDQNPSSRELLPPPLEHYVPNPRHNLRLYGRGYIPPNDPHPRANPEPSPKASQLASSNKKLQPEPTSNSSLSQCVFCRSSSSCKGGIINRLSGRLHH